MNDVQWKQDNLRLFHQALAYKHASEQAHDTYSFALYSSMFFATSRCYLDAEHQRLGEKMRALLAQEKPGETC